MTRTPGGLAARVVSGLKDRVLAGELAPGTRLPSEAELIETYGVSRTVVREAVGQLRAEGLVETHQGQGSFVLAVPEPSTFSLDSLGPMMIVLPRTRLGDAHSHSEAEHVERVQRAHAQVADAVVNGDSEAARAAMRVHLGNTRRRLSLTPTRRGVPAH